MSEMSPSFESTPGPDYGPEPGYAPDGYNDGQDSFAYVDGATEGYNTTGIISEEIAPSVEWSPYVRNTGEYYDDVSTGTENPFRDGNDSLTDGRAYVSVGQAIMNWEDNRPADLTHEQIYSQHSIKYYFAVEEGHQKGIAPSDEHKRIMNVIRTDLYTVDPDIKERNLTDKQMMDYLRDRAETMAVVCEQREAELTPIVEKFTERLIYAATEQNLPIDLHTALTKIANAKLIFVDPYNGIGKFTPHNGLGRIGLTEDAKELEDVVFHELTHIISGYEMVSDNEGPDPVEASRVGLHHIEGESDYLRWLNEAATDKLSHLLKFDDIDYNNVPFDVLFNKDHENPGYCFAEMVMREFFNGPDGRVSFGNVVAALTEDYDPHTPAGMRSPHLKNLHAHLGQVWRSSAQVDHMLRSEKSRAVDRSEYKQFYPFIDHIQSTRDRLAKA